MKVKLFVISLLFLLLSSLSIYAQDSNLVQNPGFEEGTSQDVYYWTKHAWGDQPGIADFILDDKEKHSGRNSATIINNSPTDARFRQDIQVKGNTHYKISCWIKTENVGTSNKGANISADGSLSTSKDITGTSDWQYVEVYGKTDKKQKNFILTLGLGGYGSLNTGKAWFDDVTVEELSTAPEGKAVVDLFASSTQTLSNTKSGLPSAVIVLISLLLAALFIGIIFVTAKSNKTFSKKEEKSQSGSFHLPTENRVFKLKIDSKDFLIMGILTFVYLVISLVNLGSLKVPQTSWKPAKPGESFIVDFGKDIDVERIYYYGGIGDGKFRIEYLDTVQKFVPLASIEKKDIFTWKYITAPVKTSKLKFIADVSGSTLNEVSIFENGKQQPVKDFRITDIAAESGDTGTVDHLFDEQDRVIYRPSFMTGMYFDEIYHARTAFEHIHKMQPFEWTHPPLGKLIISAGILIFGMNPFGWRIMGNLFGVLMIPLMYLFGRKLFDKKFYAFCSAFLMMFDFMHFTQTRIATIDVYGTFFIILMYYYMFDYFLNKSYVVGFKPSLKPLFLSGLFFGIGVASKWIALYGGAGLAVLFFLAKYYEYTDYTLLMNNKKLKKPEWLNHFMPIHMIGTLLYCVLFFVIIPAVIYYLSYIPYMWVPGAKQGIKLVLDYQSQMYNYHSKLVATHSFASPWYEWPIIYKPTWFYSASDLSPGKASTIVTMGNPAIWWVGIFAVVIAVMIALHKREKKMVVVFTAMIFQYLPWVLVSRITWIYHFFSTVPFMIFAIVYVIKNIMETSKNSKYGIYIYLGIVALLFIWFYPALSGLEVSKNWIGSLKWFKSWIF